MQIPIVDLSGVFSEDPRGRRSVADHLHTACVDIDFFCCVGHGVPADLVRDMFAQAARFFALSDGNGGWIAADPVEGSFVVNIGDMMQFRTHDVFRSTTHRVVNVSGRQRISIPFFFGPDEDTMIETLQG